MAGKIPVLDTIGKTYGFAFGRYLTVLGIVWLPTLVLMAAAYAFVPASFAMFADIMKHVGQKGYVPNMGPLQGWIWGFNLVEYLVLTIVTVGISKEILGVRKPPRFIYISFGAAELRVIGAYLLLLALFYGVLIVGVLGGAAVFAIGAVIVAAIGPANLHVSGAALAATGGALIGAGIFVAFVYVFIRLSYLIAPVTVAERHIAILRSWELTKGNVWRIIGIAFATIFPMFVAIIIFEVALFMPLLLGIVARVQHHQQPVVDFVAIGRSYLRYLPFYALGGLLLAPISNALVFASPNFAYRALAPEETKPASA